jgi:hypothetical protein
VPPTVAVEATLTPIRPGRHRKRGRRTCRSKGKVGGGNPGE